MSTAPEEFSGKSLFERLALLAKGGGVWMLIASLLSIVVALVLFYNQYFEAQRAQQATQYRAEQLMQTLDRVTQQARSMQSNTEDIARIASQITDPALRDDILKRTIALQSSIFELSHLYRDIDQRQRGPAKLGTSGPNSPVGHFSLPSMVSSAFAQAAPLPDKAKFTQEDARLYVMLAVFVVLGITFIISIVAIFMATNPDVLKFSFDTIKTLMGFFIGVATAFLGLPGTTH